MEQVQQIIHSSPFIPSFPSPQLLSQYHGEVLLIQNKGRTIGLDLNGEIQNPVEEADRFAKAAKPDATFMVGTVEPTNGGKFRFISRCEAFGIIERWITEGSNER